ncbi:MFS transporter [Pseudaminobacter salicylatoxidans]|uniref:MFS transporter n=1 Tax=Pseudaminobacter salicylatoxidans TaxID=93369 RepID=UPI00031CBEB5|nr:MFS transporter [Pseudaminobacter salicylatoxidans]
MNSNIDDTLPSGGAASVAASAPASWSELFRGRNAFYALALAGGVTLHAVNMYIATTVMPSVIADIGGLDFYAWATTLFVAASILGAALTAKLLKSAGPRGAYVIATLLFCIGTLVCSLALNMPVMLAGRAVQGLGGGFLYALAYGLTRVVLPERLWGRAIGLISAMFGIATLIGPAIGGVFAEYGAWRAAFWSLLPFAALFALLAFATLPRSSWDHNERVSVPFLQLVLLMGAVLAVSAGSLSAETTWKLVGLLAGLLLIALIAAVETGAKARLLPKKSFRISTPLGALYLMIALLMLSMQPEIFVPYLLQKLHGQSPLWAGYLAALMAIGWTVASFLSSRWQERGGDRLVLAGPVLALAGLVLLAVFLPVEGGGDWSLLAPISAGLILVGFGIGLAWPSLVTRVYQNAPATEQDLAAGGMTTVQLFAIAFGTACAGMVANFAGIAEPSDVAGASSAAFWLGGIFAVAPAIGVLVAVKVVRLTGR